MDNFATGVPMTPEVLEYPTEITEFYKEREKKWHKRFMDLAALVATWSKDPSTQVGAVIVRPDRTVASVGFNGFPRGVNDSEKRYNDRETKYKFVVHAEANAIMNCKDQSLEGYTMYVYPQIVEGAPPSCEECTKLVVQSGIKRVVGMKKGLRKDPKWADECGAARAMYEEAGVEMVML